MTPLLLTEMTIGLPNVSAFFVASLAASALTACLLGFAILENVWRLIRPAFIFALLCLIFFQLPSALISDAIISGLEHEWYFFLILHATPIAIASWVLVSSRLDVPADTTSSPSTFGVPTVAIFGLLVVVLALVYLNRVPFDCTALSAIVYDPQLTLLAREISIKFAGSIIATYSFGALANTAAPLAIGLAMPVLIRAILKLRLISALLCLATMGVAIGMVLLAGSKGLLIPAGLFVLASGIAWHRGLLAKLIYPALSLAILTGGMVIFELVKERPQTGKQPYPFGSCVVALDACASVAPFIASLKQREGSLGLPISEVERLDDERELACSAAELEAPPAALSPEAPPAEIEHVGVDVVDRAFSYVRALAYRAFVSPVQVASWYFLYVEEKGHPGWGAMPVGRRFGDVRVNMPSEIAKTYGRIYSLGDSTSTSSSPTSFVLAYPAYLGVVGSLIAALLVVSLDSGFMVLTRLSPTSALGVAAGFSTVISTNLILSDFVTVIETHGGALAFFILFVFALVETAKRRALWRQD
jgi:hypothetical protein